MINLNKIFYNSNLLNSPTLLSESFKDAKRKFQSEGIDPEEIKNAIIQFKQAKDKKLITGTDADIGTWINKSWSEFKAFLGEVNTRTSKRSERKIKKSDVIVHRDDDEVLILTPLSPDASILYGKDTKWCVSAKQGNLFWSYTLRNNILFFIIQKKTQKKWAAVLAANKNNSFFNEVRDQLNNSISISDIPYDLEQYKNLNFPEILNELKLKLIKSGADLSGFDLSGADLTNADLTNANLNRVNLNRVNLNRANLTGANLTGANLRYAKLIGTKLTSANLTGVDLSGFDLSGADLSDADLTNTNLKYANLTNANLTNANLTDTILISANLTNANLTGVDLSGAYLSYFYLRGANLTSVDLSYFNLSGFDLRGAILISANLSYIDLTDADLTDADLTDADLTRAILSGAKLSGAKMPENWKKITIGTPARMPTETNSLKESNSIYNLIFFK